MRLRPHGARGALALATSLVACGAPAASSTPEPGTETSGADAEPSTDGAPLDGAPLDGGVLDGLTLWNGAEDEAPAPIRERIALLRVLLGGYAAAPQPPVRFDEDRDAFRAWLNDVYLPHREATVRRVQAHVSGPPPPPGTVEERLFYVLSMLALQHAEARSIAALELGPPVFGSCDGSLEATLGVALELTRRAARACVALSAEVAGPQAGNAETCRRRGAWARTLAKTGVDGVCEVHEGF